MNLCAAHARVRFSWAGSYLASFLPSAETALRSLTSFCQLHTTWKLMWSNDGRQKQLQLPTMKSSTNLDGWSSPSDIHSCLMEWFPWKSCSMSSPQRGTDVFNMLTPTHAHRGKWTEIALLCDREKFAQVLMTFHTIRVHITQFRLMLTAKNLDNN